MSNNAWILLAIGIVILVILLHEGVRKVAALIVILGLAFAAGWYFSKHRSQPDLGQPGYATVTPSGPTL